MKKRRTFTWYQKGSIRLVVLSTDSDNSTKYTDTTDSIDHSSRNRRFSCRNNNLAVVNNSLPHRVGRLLRDDLLENCCSNHLDSTTLLGHDEFSDSLIEWGDEWIF